MRGSQNFCGVLVPERQEGEETLKQPPLLLLVVSTMNGAHTQSFLDTQQDASQPNYSFSEDFTQGTGAYPELSQFQGLTQVILLASKIRCCVQSLSWHSMQHSPLTYSAFLVSALQENASQFAYNEAIQASAIVSPSKTACCLHAAPASQKCSANANVCRPQLHWSHRRAPLQVA